MTMSPEGGGGSARNGSPPGGDAAPARIGDDTAEWPAEEEAREALCRTGAELYDAGLLGGQAGNLSVRLGPDAILVTPAGGHKGRLAPGDLVRLGLEDPEPDARGRATSELPLHLAVHRALPGARCVIHTHAPALTALGIRGEKPGDHLPEVEEALGGVAVVEFAPSGSEALGEAVAAAAEDASLLILERHGTVAVGATPEEARNRTELGELAAYTVLLAEEGGAAVAPDRVVRLARRAREAEAVPDGPSGGEAPEPDRPSPG